MVHRVYADRKGWPLESVRVRMKYGRLRAKECESGTIDKIELELEGPLDEEQSQRLKKISERCPVHQTLDSEVLIETNV